jgi:hypothetical protein
LHTAVCKSGRCRVFESRFRCLGRPPPDPLRSPAEPRDEAAPRSNRKSSSKHHRERFRSATPPFHLRLRPTLLFASRRIWPRSRQSSVFRTFGPGANALEAGRGAPGFERLTMIGLAALRSTFAPPSGQPRESHREHQPRRGLRYELQIVQCDVARRIDSEAPHVR